MISARTRAYVRRRIESYMLATVTAFRLEASSLDETSGRITSRLDPNYTGYAGKARIWTVNNAATISVGDEQIGTAVTYISLPWNAEPVPDIDDYFRVDTYEDDPELVGRYYRVLSVDGGGLYRPTRRCQVAAVTDTRWDR